MGVLPDAPAYAALAQRPEALRSERRGWGWNSLTRHHFGMSTGQARRACLLNSACLRASGASPRHSAIAGVVQQQNAAVPRPRRRCDSVHPLHFRPCGVVQPTRLPLMQEITGAKPVRDANSHAPKALSAMHSLGQRISPVQLRVGAPLLLTVRNGGHAQASQSSQRSGGFHKPAVSRAALETATILAPMQQPADFFCKAILPGQHRLEASSLWRCASSSRSPMQRHDVESVASAGASPVASTNFMESKPQQTGTRLLPGHGEGATTSGSTNSFRPVVK